MLVADLSPHLWGPAQNRRGSHPGGMIASTLTQAPEAQLCSTHHGKLPYDPPLLCRNVEAIRGSIWSSEHYAAPAWPPARIQTGAYCCWLLPRAPTIGLQKGPQGCFVRITQTKRGGTGQNLPGVSVARLASLIQHGFYICGMSGVKQREQVS